MKSSNLACCWRKFLPAGLVVSSLRVRCMRSWRPFCCGLPGLMRSIAMPSLSHQTNAVIGANGLGQSELLENGLEYAERVGFFGGGERLAREDVAAGKVGDGERITVATVGEHEFALIVGAPQLIGLSGKRECRSVCSVTSRSSALDQAVAIKHGMHRADRGCVHIGITV